MPIGVRCEQNRIGAGNGSNSAVDLGSGRTRLDCKRRRGWKKLWVVVLKWFSERERCSSAVGVAAETSLKIQRWGEGRDDVFFLLCIK